MTRRNKSRHARVRLIQQPSSGRRAPTARIGLRLVLAALLVMAGAALALASGVAAAAEVRIPEASALYRLKLERLAAARFGIDAPVARFAAQVHQESHWRPDVASKYAQGLTQFTPATAAWLPDVCPDVGAPDPWDPDWSLRAMVCYDAWLYHQVAAADACSRWAFVLSSYNGGLGNLTRDQARAIALGARADVWFGHVELHSGRAAWAMDENRKYVRRILRTLEPAYAAAGWPGDPVCTELSAAKPCSVVVVATPGAECRPGVCQAGAP